MHLSNTQERSSMKSKSHTNRYCYSCGSTETGTNKKKDGTLYPIWYLNYDDDGSALCTRCYNHLYSHPKWNKITNAKFNPRMIRFLGKYVLLSFSPRKGMCSKCGRTVSNGEIKQTQMNHLMYIPIAPWACTEELCVRCHRKDHIDRRDLDTFYLSVGYAERKVAEKKNASL
jgi:hypothetical protein